MTTSVGACLALGWAAVAGWAYAHDHLPPTFGVGLLTWVLPLACASGLLVVGGFRGWAHVPASRRGRDRIAGIAYPAALAAGLGGIALAMFLFVMCSMIGAFP